MKVSENVEAAIVGTAALCEAVAGGLATAPIPIEVKAAVVTPFAVAGLAIGAFWKAAVNKQTAT